MNVENTVEAAHKAPLLPSGWWNGIPLHLRDRFERRILREGYLLNQEYSIAYLLFFRGTYLAQIFAPESEFTCVYQVQTDLGPKAAPKLNCSCSKTAPRCAHEAALLFHVHDPRHGKQPFGTEYATSLWAALALGLCRTYTRITPSLKLEGSNLHVEDEQHREILTLRRPEGWPDSLLENLPSDGWEKPYRIAQVNPDFLSWANEALQIEDRALIQSLGYAPAQRAEFGILGFLCRLGYWNAPQSRGILDWDPEVDLFRLTLGQDAHAFSATLHLNAEQAYSLRRKFPEIALGQGFAENPMAWQKNLEIRVAEGSRLRIRPYVVPHDVPIVMPEPEAEASPKLPSQSSRIDAPAEGEAPRFGDMPYLQGVGFCRPQTSASALMQRYTGWKTYWVETAKVPEFLAKYGAEFNGPDCDLDPLLNHPHAVTLDVLQVHVHAREGNRYHLDMHFDFGSQRLSLQELASYHATGLSCIFTPAGLIDFKAPEWSWLDPLSVDHWVAHPNAVMAHRDMPEARILRIEAPRLYRICTLFAARRIEVKSQGIDDLNFLTNLQSDPDGSDLPATDLASRHDLPAAGLRPYQVEGLQWLARLADCGLSGILADDMGLGKTHQIMALMAWLHARLQRRTASVIKPRILIVAPTSVLHHWHDRIHTYHPELKAGVFHGSTRDTTLLESGICITSYGIIRNDIERFKAQTFDLVVLDEVQVCKNRDSETYQSIRQIPSQCTIGLTGTPLENHVSDIKNLYDLILPGYFPDDAQFQREIIEPLEVGSHASAQAKTRFLRLVKPFLLRRTKQQVLTDLPEKTIEDYHCEMTPEQSELYFDTLYKRGGPLVNELTGSGKPSLLHVFQLLNHLKQICNHPMTLAGDETPAREYKSGKWELFTYLLEKSLSAGRKVVVFSQYLRMLEWIEAHLRREGIGFASLTGSTTNRPAVLKRFAEDPDCKVFCCSLKAGGVGIDLTAAETVIHYDRWWNAARENQATDRVHRIGQTKNVQVFKLITLNTIEERIDAIIRKKAAWMNALVPEDPEGLSPLFTKDELLEILRGARP